MKLYFDALMLAVVSGKERSEKEAYKITPLVGLKSPDTTRKKVI